MPSNRPSGQHSALAVWAGPTLLALLASLWFSQVTQLVPHAYLDEVFHVRQAATYWAGHWTTWDPKITTPPGLYGLSYVWLGLLHLLHIPGSLITHLRSLNLLIGLGTIFLASWALLPFIPEAEARPSLQEDGEPSVSPAQAGHTALNIALFPPLFFFSALYYTDLLSVSLLLLAYLAFLAKRPALVLLLGLLSLAFRQTNVFWAALYFAGLDLVRELGSLFPTAGTAEPMSLLQVVQQSWQLHAVYDPLLKHASLEDYGKTLLSYPILLIAVVYASIGKNAHRAALIRLTRCLAPYFILLVLFALFVLVNGGVVLGDKENHVASLHLAQMLYLWPYIVFCSFPILLPVLMENVVIPILDLLFSHPGRIREKRPYVLQLTLPIAFCFFTLTLVLGVIRYNTIVHPFTLADNRHYTFYVFRILLRPGVRYFVAPLYLFCAWAAIKALGCPSTNLTRLTASDIGTSSMAKPGKKQPGNAKVGSTFPAKPKSGDDNSDANNSIASPTGRNRVSFVLVWTISTALSLVTAPLVEPRYFIVPWLFWRLHVPAAYTTLKPSLSEKDSISTRFDTLARVIGHNSLWMETAWFLIVNLATCYIFLYCGFEWPQEKGQVQRFMW